MLARRIREAPAEHGCAAGAVLVERPVDRDNASVRIRAFDQPRPVATFCRSAEFDGCPVREPASAISRRPAQER